MEVMLRQCAPGDADILHILSRKTFGETFARHNSLSNMRAYMDRAFAIDKLRAELSGGDSIFYFIYAKGKLAGYLKLNEATAQTDINDIKSLEIERIYVAQEFQGEGLGSALMNKAIEIANMQKRSYIWLGVWEKNHKAILFYKKNSFYKIGTHSFFMGEEEQTDFIMRKDLQAMAP